MSLDLTYGVRTRGLTNSLGAGDLSRNRTVGLRIGKGESLADITASMTAVAEGVLTSRYTPEPSHGSGQSATLSLECIGGCLGFINFSGNFSGNVCFSTIMLCQP